MRIAKRALAVLLILAVLTSALLVVSFADDVPEVDCEDLLTYFDPLTSKPYVNDSFEDGTYDGKVSITATDAVTKAEVVGGDNGSYLSFVAGSVASAHAVGEMVYVADTTEVPEGRDALYIRYSVNAAYTAKTVAECSARCGYFAESDGAELPDVCPLCESAVNKNASKAPTVSVYVGSDASAIGQRLVTLDFDADFVTYYGGSNYVTSRYELSENSDVWYTVEIVLFENNKYQLTVKNSDNVKVVEAIDLAAPTVGTTASVAFGYAYTADNRDTVVNLDDVLVQCGTEYRAISAAELEEKMVGAVDDFIAILQRGSDMDKKLEVIDTYNTIVDFYGFTATNSDLVADMASMDGIILDVYYNILKDAIAAFDPNADYQVRVDHAKKHEDISSKVAELAVELAVTDPAYLEAVSAYNAEAEALALEASNTEAFIAFINDSLANNPQVFYTNDYDQLSAFCGLVEQSYPYNATYPGVELARESYVVVANKYALYCKQAEAFVKAVDTASSTDESVALSARLEAYEYATTNYFIYDTFPGVSDAITTLATLTDFADIKAAAMDFISKLTIAEESIYIDAKEVALEAAEAAMDLANDDYVGVADAKARCVQLRAEITAKRAAAAEYIAAVDALAGLKGQALIDAVEVALEKQKTGNVAGIAGVTEANIALNNAYMQIENARAYSEKFITLVGEIKNAESIAERYVAIKAAKSAEALADDSVDGVSAAKSTLASAVSAYNADASAVNGAYATAAGNAGDLSGATMSVSTIAAFVIAFIKSIIK